ncbi:unnamed protein product [Clonostachys rosea f. rosea IK726]|uniref:Uncharacterized protein n=2 Tax=Bionectria ochroleuca TaxID=29856 RepID=A0A0B7KH00_BIOOC|nr:unnamed protein product [Clonostachys rosea f. rosea IK726]
MSNPKNSVLITGCSAGGIGAALAQVFQEKGYDVFATARTPSKISRELSTASNVTILTLDVVSSKSITAAVESVRKVTGGKLDILINNSGMPFRAPGLDVPIEEGKKLFDLNFWAPLEMLQAFAPLLIEAKGCVVNNSSCSAVLPMGLCSIYGASKAALTLASETWRLELEPLGVRTITISTCATKSNAQTNGFKAKIPETSPYYSIREFIEKPSDMQAKAITAREYAIKVVREVEAGTAGIIWVGTNSLMARLVASMPGSILDSVVESVIPVQKEMAKAISEKNSS